MPVMKIGNVTTGMDTQEKVNEYWKGLSNKYGFKQLTVEGSSKGKLFFLAEPKIVKTESQKSVDKYIGNAMGYLSIEVIDSLRRIVDQLNKCDYENETGVLQMNTAFIALKQIAGK